MMNNISNNKEGSKVNTLLTAGWIKVEDKMPVKMQFVLFCEYEDFGFCGKTQTFHIGWFDNTNAWFSECSGWIESKTKVTHWMPLPSAPACS